MSTNFKYTAAELAGYETSTAKKMVGVTRKDGIYWRGEKQIFPVEEAATFLKEYYDDPLTGMKGRDRLYSSIYSKYLGISRVYIAEWLANLETNQIHTEPKNEDQQACRHEETNGSVGNRSDVVERGQS